MTSNSNKGRTRPSVAQALATLTLFTATSILFLFSPVTALGQGMPPRGDTLMRTKPLTKPPLTDTQRLRRDIVNATNPVTGTINVQQFKVQTSILPGEPTASTPVTTQYSTQGTVFPDVTPPDKPPTVVKSGKKQGSILP
ncbi:MAG: hypothetical protein V1792_03605 [Pseudomonadota bacterium]